MLDACEVSSGFRPDRGVAGRVTWLSRGLFAWVGCTMVLTACPRFSSARAEEEPSRPPKSFEPGDISIGEPIALPFAAAAVPASPPMTPLTAAASAPNGWLGMAVAESAVPGRWSIVEVAPNSPAAAAGIRTGDELRAIDGVAPRNSDEVAQAMTAIASGQKVVVSVARADQVGDVPLVAAPRPVVSPPLESSIRESRTATQQPLTPIAPQQPVVVVPPPPAAAPTASVLVEPRVEPRVEPTFSPRASVPVAGPVPAFVPAERQTVAPAFVPPPTPVAPAIPTAALPAAELASQATPRGRTALGVRTVPIDPGIQSRFRLPEAAGAYVIGVVGDLPASKAGVPPGSVIVKLGNRPVRSPQELTQLVATGPIDRPVPLDYVLPGGTEKRADVVLQSLDQPLEQALVGDGPMQPTTAPALEPGPAPRTSRRPVTPAEAEVGELRREVGLVRAWLDMLERRLERLSRSDR